MLDQKSARIVVDYLDTFGLDIGSHPLTLSESDERFHGDPACSHRKRPLRLRARPILATVRDALERDLCECWTRGASPFRTLESRLMTGAALLELEVGRGPLFAPFPETPLEAMKSIEFLNDLMLDFEIFDWEDRSELLDKLDAAAAACSVRAEEIEGLVRADRFRLQILEHFGAENGSRRAVGFCSHPTNLGSEEWRMFMAAEYAWRVDSDSVLLLAPLSFFEAVASRPLSFAEWVELEASDSDQVLETAHTLQRDAGGPGSVTEHFRACLETARALES